MAPVLYNSDLRPWRATLIQNYIDNWIQPTIRHSYITTFISQFCFYFLHNQYKFRNFEISLKYDCHVIRTSDVMSKMRLKYAPAHTVRTVRIGAKLQCSTHSPPIFSTSTPHKSRSSQHQAQEPANASPYLQRFRLMRILDLAVYTFHRARAFASSSPSCITTHPLQPGLSSPSALLRLIYTALCQL